MASRWIAAAALALSVVPAAAGAADGAEVELVGSAVSRAGGASAVFGYDPPGAPELVSSEDVETPLGPHAGHEDARFDRTRLYRSGARVNAERSRGSEGTARGEVAPGHSIAVVSGWADAGSNGLGGSAEAFTGEGGTSEAAGVASMRIEKRITIQPGLSGLAPGTLVTGLSFELGGRGLLEVAGATHPGVGGSSAGADLDILVLRGPTGTCGAFDCPQGALAVAANLLTSLAFQSLDPLASGGRTGRATRQRSWSASNNTGPLKAGAVFDSGSDAVEVGLPITDADSFVFRVEGVDTGGDPLGLDAIEFEANVGEVLRVELDLDVSGSVAGRGWGDADFFDTLGGRVVDPLGRGLVFESSVPVPEPPRAALLLAAAAWLSLCAKPGRPGPGCASRGWRRVRDP